MKLFEMEGFLRGKCLPGDMKVNESNAEYLVRKFSELTAERDANQAAMNTITALMEILGTSDTLSISGQVAELKARVDALGAENSGLKSNLMFWDAENPESPYDNPGEIAEACSLNYNEEFVVQVAAKMPNRVYRVCESWEQECKLELVEGGEVKTPATDAFLAEVRSQGVEMFAYRLKQFIDDGDFVGSEIPLIVGCIDCAADMAAQLRKGVQS